MSLTVSVSYLQTLFPLIASAVSLLYLLTQTFRRIANTKKSAQEGLQADAKTSNGHAGPFENDAQAGTTDLPVLPDDDSERLVLKLSETKTSDSSIQANRPRGQQAVIFVELLAILAITGIRCFALSESYGNAHRRVAASAQLANWGYILLLVLTRLWNVRRPIKQLPNLWYQTAWLYIIQWVINILIFRSAIIHPRSQQAQTLRTLEFALSTLLAVIAVTSRKGNRTVMLEYEDKLEPSHEPLANLFSTWTYGWVDALVWKGYRKTLEIEDVWNLAARDKAAAVLADFRLLGKTTALIWRLLKFFKRDLLIQLAWAVASGFFTFGPTLLMKAFLEFVEDPGHTPVNAAWFYIVLLALTSCIKAITDGQALWIGRKICIRLRAVIVGEIYAKSLRRKAAAGKDTVLGETMEQAAAEKKEAKEKATKALSDDDPKKKLEASDSQANVGTIINLMAVDSFKVSEISAYLHFLWGTTPIQMVVCIVLLYRILGLSSLAGIIMMALALPVNMYIAKQFTRIQRKVMAATDVRIHTTNEILQNIRIIKYFAWEERFGQIVGENRQTELRALRNKYILWTAAAGVWFGVPVLITFFSFLLYTLVEKKPLIPSVAFTALSLFGLLRFPLDQLADMVAHVQESKVSIGRVEEFMNEDETEKYDQLIQTSERNQEDEPVIGFDHATLSWGGQDSKNSDGQTAFRMINMDLRFQVGGLNIIAGPTGSGKTSMLMALLGEMTLFGGRVHLPCGASREDIAPNPVTGLTESIAYCAQQAWLVNDTIKQNILFASPLDDSRYRIVLAACALERDLEILDGGDSTLVGEKGITLSGGQKQRISLARALYSNCRHVLLDDCLSAVDSHTAKHIFENCIMGPLMLGRTCILVTHNLALCVPQSNFVVVLSNGKVAAQGSPEEMTASGVFGDEIQISRPNSKGASMNHSRAHSTANLASHMNGDANGQATESNGHVKGPTDKDTAEEGEHKPTANARTEKKATGSVDIRVIQMYLAAMGSWRYWTLAFAAFALQQISSVGSNVWIKYWANAYTLKTQDIGISKLKSDSNRTFVTHGITISSSAFSSNGPFWNLEMLKPSTASASFSSASDEVDAGYYLGVYGALALSFIIISLLREAFIFWGSLRASAKLHRRLFDAVTRARLQFFDTTPLGQLMNRFSKDIEAIDQDVSPVAVGVLGCLFSLISIVVLICVITPRFLIAGLFISLIYFAIGQFYLRSSRNLKRLESVQRSPIYQQFGETLSGVVTIRAYGDERRFIRDNQTRVDTHNRPFLFLWATNRWLALRVDFAGALVAFFAGVFVILSIKTIDAGSAGLSLTYAVMFTENVLWLVRLYAANEQNMNSVERIKEYMEIEQEAKAIIDDARPPGNWPSHGAIQFFKYTTRYRADLDPVLRDLTFNILPGERVGIVGRTGAGKSSLALALFRGLEADSGKILIDDIDIGLIGLQDLREAITIVPQDPTLFTGTVRSNLDPFGLFTDEEIFSTLRNVHLIEGPESGAASSSASPLPPITLTPPKTPASNDEPPSDNDLVKAITNTRENTNIFTNLSSPIAESGSNLSQGQRQMLCLARALLKAPRVLVMDEATASIDYATDGKIQDTLRDVKGSTIITIAHRLQTIIDYDKVLVLDQGEVTEFDSPWELLSREGGIFKGMCEMSGDLEALMEGAKKAEDKHKLVDV